MSFPNTLSTLIVIFFLLVIVSIIVIVATHIRSSEKASRSETKSKDPDSIYTYTVSLSSPLYVNDELDSVFRCSGAIITDRWILTGVDCFLNESDWSNVQVRAGSMYWSKGGTRHNILKKINLINDGPILLNIYPLLKFNEYVKSVKLPPPEIFKFDWSQAACISWHNSKQQKTFKCSFEYWSKRRCDSADQLGEMKEFVTEWVKPKSSPLITSNGVLVGYKLGMSNYESSGKLSVFLSFENGEYRNWLERLIYTDIPSKSVEDFDDNINFNRRTILFGFNQLCNSLLIKE